MFGFLFKTPAWQLVMQADTMTKFVLFVLFCVSIFCVWIIICKFLVLYRQKAAILEMQKKIRSVESIEKMISIGKKYKETAGGRFLLQGLKDLKKTVGSRSKISAKDFDHFQMMLDQSLDFVLEEEDRYMPVLSTSAAVAPLIGLFGTVWGLVHAFVEISRSKSADISVVAPGIAEALTTTLGGLIVAIPALIFFHYFSNEMRKLELKLLSISDRLSYVVKNTFVEGH
jgi:biopolymer transport protein TolQ